MKILSQLKKPKHFSGIEVLMFQFSDLMEKGNFIEALDLCLGQVKKYPHYIVGKLLLAECYTELKNWNKAILEYIRIIEMDSLCLGALRGLARVYQLQGDLEMATITYEKVIEIDKADLSALEKVKKLKNVVKKSSQNNYAKTNEIATPTLAEIYLAQGFLQEAYQIYEKLSKQHPNKKEFQEKMQKIKLSFSSLSD